MCMKRIATMVAALGVACLFLFSPGGTVQASEVTVNGRQADDAMFVIENSTTMVSETFLQDLMKLSLEREGAHLRLHNDAANVQVDGALGDRTYRLNGEEKSFSVMPQERNGQVFLPLRSLVENFGQVDWNAESGNVNVRFAYNDRLALPSASVSEKPLRFERIIDAGVEATREWTPVLQDKGGMIGEAFDEENNLVRVYSRDHTLIEPVHKEFVLGKDSYVIGSDWLVWVEYPKGPAQGGDWYLYAKRLRDSQPVCISSGSFSALSDGLFEKHVLGNVAAVDGTIAYVSVDTAANSLELCLYQDKTGKSVVLDRLALSEYPNGNFSLAMNSRFVFWSKNLSATEGAVYGSMNRYDLQTGKTTPFYEGCNLSDPKLTETFLMVRSLPLHQGALEKGDGRQGSELWVYSLADDNWSFKVDGRLPFLAEKAVVTKPVALDDHHMTFNVEGMSSYDLPVVDLRSGVIQLAKNKAGETLRYSPQAQEEGAVFRLSPVISASGDETHLATLREGGMTVVAPFVFEFDR